MAEINAIIKDDKKLMEITKTVFDEVNKDCTGEIDKAELWYVMTCIAEQASIEPPKDAQVDEVFKALDTDHSGTIDVKEFKFLMKEVLKALQDSYI